MGKLNYIVASGIKQRDIEGCFELEAFLKLDQITPMQTSYTQTAVDREKENVKDNGKEDDSDPSDLEPSDKKEKKSSTDEE